MAAGVGNGDGKPRGRASAWISHGLEVLIDELSSSTAPAAAAADDDPNFDVVIVGSGYGAAIVADRLAQQMPHDEIRNGRKLRVCVLERGREYLPGAFPRRLSELPGHLRFTTPAKPGAQGRLEGLFDLRVGDDMSVLIANGLGGGSLINAGVMEFASGEVFNEAAWPDELRGQAAYDALAQRAHQHIRPQLGAARSNGTPSTVEPPTFNGELARQATLRKLGSAGGAPAAFRATAISVALSDDHVTSGGVRLNKCVACGDCFTGCNFDAKDSLDVNLLRRAQRNDVRLFTGATVAKLRQRGGGAGWALDVWHTDAKLRERMAGPLELTTRRVVLAAGTLGSTELLLRSQGKNLAFSTQLGRRFSGNGDMIASIFDSTAAAGGVAGEHETPALRRAGPTITSMVDLRASAGCVIQDLGVPAALRRLFEEAATTSSLLHRIDTFDGSRHDPDGHADIADPYAVDPAKMKRSIVVAIIGRDAGDGVMEPVKHPREHDAHDPWSSVPSDAGLRIVWPQARNDARLEQWQAKLAQLAETSGVGRTVPDPSWWERFFEWFPLRHKPAADAVLPNPMWRLLPKDVEDLLGARRGPLVTVHPLGGCAMGNDRVHGVVNHRGEVFDADAAAAADAVHEGLVVIDGSIVPTSLGINPALTIATLADRAIASLLAGPWSDLAATAVVAPAADAPEQRPVFKRIDPHALPQPERRTRVQVVEKLAGRVAFGDTFYRVEWRLAYAPAGLRELAVGPDPSSGYPIENDRRMGRTLHLDPQHSRVLVFSDGDEPADDGENDPRRNPDDALFDAPLAHGSTLRILHRERSCWGQRVWRSWWPWLLQRGLRDAVQALGEWWRGEGGTLSLGKRVRQSFAVATRAGEVRRFEYQLILDAPRKTSPEFEQRLSKGSSIVGIKRVTYGWRSSPWTQVMRLELERFGRLDLRHRREDRRLHVDPMHFARMQVPLARVVDQQDQPTALADVAGFLLYVARVMIGVHLLTFRKPDAPSTHEPQRLPGPLARLPQPQIHELGSLPPPTRLPTAEPGLARLTHYPPKDPSTAKPVLMIHGYSASGTTFAHHTLRPSLAQYLWEQGFDPWIVDLRTSCGLPSATLPWSFEDMARHDIPAAMRFILRATGRDKIDVVSHCMGSAMLAMTILDPDRPAQAAFKAEDHIDAWLMSQIGPAMRLTPANMLRAYLLRYVIHLLPRISYEFRAGGKAPGVDGDMFDRFLAALPNLNDEHGSEFDIENPHWPLSRTPWVGTRHRVDALFGRVFDSRNLSKATLDHIDDFFGPFNLVSVSQPIYFARLAFVTDTLGRRFGYENLARFAKLRMTSLHGKRNGLADPQTQRRLAGRLGLGALRRPSGARSYRETQRFDSLGHQDSLIGTKTAEVFAAISRFLR